MLYFILNWLQKITIRLYFRDIHIANLDTLPRNKPVVIACNHPGAFMDPCFISAIVPKPIYFTTRGDVFANPIIRRFFKAIHLNPVYRFDEGFNNLSKNFETIEDLTKILKNNGIVLIFSEGYGAVDRRLKPLRKGTARIFMQIALEHDLDIELYAAGLTYTHKINFRKSVMCSFSKPLHLKDYLNDFISHRQRGYHTFTRELATRISENFVVVKHPHCDEIVDYHINYFCNDESLSRLPVIRYTRKKLNILQSLSHKINALYHDHPETYAQLEKKTLAYETGLRKNQITDLGLVKPTVSWAYLLLLPLIAPLLLCGAVFWGIPFLISKWISDKKVTRVDFYDSVSSNVMALLYGLLTVVGNILLAYQIGWWSLLIYVVAPVPGLVTFWTYDLWHQFREVRKAWACPERSSLLKLRAEIRHFHQDIE